MRFFPQTFSVQVWLNTSLFPFALLLHSSGWGVSDVDGQLHNSRIHVATRLLLHYVMPGLVNELCAMTASQLEALQHLSATGKASGSLSHMLHSRGINMRHLGWISHQVRLRVAPGAASSRGNTFSSFEDSPLSAM